MQTWLDWEFDDDVTAGRNADIPIGSAVERVGAVIAGRSWLKRYSQLISHLRLTVRLTDEGEECAVERVKRRSAGGEPYLEASVTVPITMVEPPLGGLELLRFGIGLLRALNQIGEILEIGKPRVRRGLTGASQMDWSPFAGRSLDGWADIANQVRATAANGRLVQVQVATTPEDGSAGRIAVALGLPEEPDHADDLARIWSPS